MKQNRKRRSDHKLSKLNPEQKTLLRTWLVDENLSYEKAQERLMADFNLHISTGALSDFYATECFSLRSSQAKHFAENIVSELTESGSNYDAATMALIKQKAFERAYARDGNVDELATLAKIIGDSAKLKLKERDQQLTERRIILLEAKAALADKATEIAGNEQLTEEEKGKRLRSLFGMG